MTVLTDYPVYIWHKSAVDSWWTRAQHWSNYKPSSCHSDSRSDE